MPALAHIFRATARTDTSLGLSDESTSPTLIASNQTAASSIRTSSNRVVNTMVLPVPDAVAGPTEDRSFIEILGPPTIIFRGVGQDVEPVRFSGTVILHLSEPTVLKDVTVEFIGKAKLPVPPSPDVKPQTSYAIYAHDISFMPQASQASDRKQSRTFKAGRHAFPFEIDIEPYLPSSLRAPRAQIVYKLRATAVRSSLLPNYTCTFPVSVVRSLGPNSLEYQQTIEVESTWQGKLMYSLTLPHKAWAAGDTVMTLVKFQPLSKGVSVAEVCSMIIETAQYSGLPGIEMKKDVCSARHIFSCPASSSQVASERTPTQAQQLSEDSRPGPVHAEATAPRDGVGPGPSVGVNEEGQEIVAKVELKIPSWACPSHSVAPINVSHRILWVININNPDGHTSELRCTLPIHILSHHVLEEAIQAAAPTRRLLFGIDDLILPVSEQVELPSYHAHVQDPVADAADGWPLHSTSGTTSASTAAGSRRVRSLSNPSIPASREASDSVAGASAQRQAERRAGTSSRRAGAPAARGAGSSGRPVSSHALSAVPDYATASRGGVPPLSSAAGLPSYSEAAPDGLRARHVVRRSCSDGSLATRARQTDPATAVPRTAPRRTRQPRAPPPSTAKSLFLRGPTRMVPPGVPFASTWLTQQRTVNR